MPSSTEFVSPESGSRARRLPNSVSGASVGVTALDALDWGPSPISFVALTTNV